MTAQSDSSNATPEANITVSVHKSSFCMIPSLYHKVEKLPWKHRRGSHHLNANADVFELLLQFLMLGKLPLATQLTSRQAVELLKMTEYLDRKDTLQLVEHVKIFQEAMQPNRKSSSLFSRRLSSSSSFRAKHSKRTPDDEKTFISKTTVTSTKEKEMDRFPMSGAEVTLSIITVNDEDQTNLQVAHSMDSTETSCGRTLSGDPLLTLGGERVNHQIHRHESPLSQNLFDEHLLTLTVNQEALNPFDIYGLTAIGQPVDAPSSVLPQSSSLSFMSSSSSSSPSSSSSFSYSTSNSFRNLFQKRRTKEISRIHAEWCASEYVL